MAALPRFPPYSTETVYLKDPASMTHAAKENGCASGRAQGPTDSPLLEKVVQLCSSESLPPNLLV